MRLLFLSILLSQMVFSAEIIGFLTKYVPGSTYYPSAAELSRLTQVNVFPYQMSSFGQLSTNWTCAEVNRLQGDGLKVYFTIGGANLSDNFEPAIRNSLNTFTSNIVNEINRCGYDGVDIDWEYPNATGQAALFKQFMSALRTKMNSQTPGKKISVDVPTVWLENIWGAEPFEPGSSVYDDADYINVMNYDDFRSNQRPNHSGFEKMHFNMNFWEQRVSQDKLVLGVPFYGRPITGENDLMYSQMNPADNSVDEYLGYYYNGPEMMFDKGTYAKSAGYHGVMYWAMNVGFTSMDKNAANSNSLLNQLHQGLNAPAKSGGRPGYTAFEPNKAYVNEFIFHDGFFWRQKISFFQNFAPYASGSDQVDLLWESNTEPWCDDWYLWQIPCTYSNQRFIEYQDVCYELNEGVTSTSGVEPALAPSEWTEADCTPCNTIDYGEPWSQFCIYRPGEVISHNDFLWEAKDLTSLGIDSIPLNTTPSSNNDLFWENIGSFDSTLVVSSSQEVSSSEATISIFQELNPNFEVSTNAYAISWSGLNNSLGQGSIVNLSNSLGQTIESHTIQGDSGQLQWNNPLVQGVYWARVSNSSYSKVFRFNVNQ